MAEANGSSSASAPVLARTNHPRAYTRDGWSVAKPPRTNRRSYYTSGSLRAARHTCGGRGSAPNLEHLQRPMGTPDREEISRRIRRLARAFARGYRGGTRPSPCVSPWRASQRHSQTRSRGIGIDWFDLRVALDVVGYRAHPGGAEGVARTPGADSCGWARKAGGACSSSSRRRTRSSSRISA